MNPNVPSSPSVTPRRVPREYIKVQCLECNRRFRISPNAIDPECSHCGSTDLDSDPDPTKPIDLVTDDRD